MRYVCPWLDLEVAVEMRAATWDEQWTGLTASVKDRPLEDEVDDHIDKFL